VSRSLIRAKRCSTSLESTQGVGQLSSTQQTMPFLFSAVSQSVNRQHHYLRILHYLGYYAILGYHAILDTADQRDLNGTGVRTGNTSGSVTVAGSSEQYNGGASVQTQEKTASIATVQGGRGRGKVGL